MQRCSGAQVFRLPSRKAAGKLAAEDLIKAINEKEKQTKLKPIADIPKTGYDLFTNDPGNAYVALGEKYILFSPKRDLLESRVPELGTGSKERVTANVFVDADLDRIRDIILAKAPEREGSEARTLFTKFGLMEDLGRVNVTVSHQGTGISATVNGAPGLQNVLTTAYILAVANRMEHRPKWERQREKRKERREKMKEQRQEGFQK